MADRRALVSFILLLAAAHQLAAAPSSSIPPRTLSMDAAGRPLQDDRGQRIEYRSTPKLNPLLAEQAAVAGAKVSQGSKVQKGRSRTMQSSGASPSYAESWRTASFGSGIGATGIGAVDADGDGDNELVLGGGVGFGGNTYWSIVGFNPATREYDILWQSPARAWSASISALHVVQEGNTKRVWVGASDGHVEVVNVLTRSVVGTLNPANGAINDVTVADADNDAEVDVVVATDSKLFLYDPTTLALTRTIAYGGSRVAVANVDADSRREIVLNTGSVLDVSGGVVTLQWSTTAFGSRIGLADVDADGKAELIAAESWYTIRAWDLDAQSLKWSLNADLDIAAFRLIDVAGDAVPEIVYGDGQWGEIHVIDAATRTESWNIPNPEHGVTDIAVTDSDGDGATEILWGAGWSSTGPDYLFVHDATTRAREWRSFDFSGPYEAVDLGDVDADGRSEIVVASYESESGYADGLVMVFDAATHVLEWRSDSNVFDRNAWTGVHGLKLANVDADPQLEIIVATDRLYDGALYVIDGLTHARQNAAYYDSGSPLTALDAADLTGDGRPEVVVGNGYAHSGSPGAFMHVLDPVTGAVVWKSASLNGGVSDVLVADVGGAGVDLIGANGSVQLVRWSDRRHLTSAAAGYLSVTAADVTGTAEREILAGRSDGAVDVLDGESLGVIASYLVCSAPITAIQMHAPTRIIVTCDSSMSIYDLATSSTIDTTLSNVTDLGRSATLVQGVLDSRAIVLAGGAQAVKFTDLSGNHLPVLDALSASVHWRGSIDLQMTASDSDGDPLKYEFGSLPALGSATWQNRDLGVFRYAGRGLRTGQDTLLIRVSDGAQYSAPQPVSITLTNTSPQAQPSALSFHWRGEQSAALAGGDADNDPLTFSITATAQRGIVQLSDAGTGAITYTPSGAYVGADSLSYNVTDGADSAAVTVAIALTNTTPTASGAQYDVASGNTVHARFSAADADSDPLTYSVIQQPAQGTLTFEVSSGLFQYTPSATGSGRDTIVFSVSDGVAQAQASVEMRYAPATSPSSSQGGGGGGGGGGNFGALLLTLLAPLALRGRRSARGLQNRDWEGL